MKVRKVFHPDVVSIEAWQTLHDAAGLMFERKYGCLPVLNGGELCGILTERDLVEALANDEDPQEATVFDYMTETPKTVEADDDCTVAATEMLSNGCRHLPVLEGGKLVGVVSARDLLPLATAGVVE